MFATTTSHTVPASTPAVKPVSTITAADALRRILAGPVFASRYDAGSIAMARLIDTFGIRMDALKKGVQ